MAVNTLASCVLLILSTYFNVRSTVLRSKRFKARYQIPRRKAIFFASARETIEILCLVHKVALGFTCLQLSKNLPFSNRPLCLKSVTVNSILEHKSLSPKTERESCKLIQYTGVMNQTILQVFLKIKHTQRFSLTKNKT